MASVDFFGVRDDLRSLVAFLLTETDVWILEHSSLPNRELRRFQSVEAVDEAFQLGIDVHGNGSGALLRLWSPRVMPALRTRRIDYVIKGVPGHRHEPEGGALMQLYLGGIHQQAVIKSHFGHNSPARAATWGVAEGADWNALEMVSRKIRNYIRRHAAARVPGRPILAGAAALWAGGYALKEMKQSPFHWEATGLCRDSEE